MKANNVVTVVLSSMLQLKNLTGSSCLRTTIPSEACLRKVAVAVEYQRVDSERQFPSKRTDSKCQSVYVTRVLQTLAEEFNWRRMRRRRIHLEISLTNRTDDFSPLKRYEQ